MFTTFLKILPQITKVLITWQGKVINWNLDLKFKKVYVCYRLTLNYMNVSNNCRTAWSVILNITTYGTMKYILESVGALQICHLHFTPLSNQLFLKLVHHLVLSLPITENWIVSWYSRCVSCIYPTFWQISTLTEHWEVLVELLVASLQHIDVWVVKFWVNL